MRFYATIQELIDSIKQEEVSYRNLHTPIYLTNNNEETIRIPYKSIIRDYLPALRKTTVMSNFSEREKIKYRFKPKMLSNDLYGTPELWSALLEVNGYLSLLDLTMERPMLVFDPREFRKMLNEVMILEEIIK